MRRGTLTDNTPFIGIKIEHFVKFRDFANHLALHFERESLPFPEKLTKKEAMKILCDGLFHYGLKGELDFEYYDGAFEFWERYNPLREAAEAWIKKNYPYLTPTT